MPKAMFICRFDSTLDLFKRRGRGNKRPTYEEVKERVLEAGRFSVFEATYNATAIALFERLERDPELVCDNSVPYPWTMVRRKRKAKSRKLI